MIIFFLNASFDDDLAFFCEFERIVAEVDEDLAETERIALGVGRNRGVDIEDEFEALSSGFFGDEVGDVFENLV